MPLLKVGEARNMRYRTIRAILAFAICCVAPLSSASATMLFVFSPAADGGVDVVGSGSGFSDRLLPISSDDWDIQDFVTNFMVIDNGATLGADTESGTFANLTDGTFVNIVSFSIDEDLATGFDNDIDFDTDAPIDFDFGDEMSFSLTAHFTPGTLTIDDLVIGTHIDEGHTTGAGIAEESFGITTVHVIPEPSSTMLALAGLATAGMYRRRKLS